MTLHITRNLLDSASSPKLDNIDKIDNKSTEEKWSQEVETHHHPVKGTHPFKGSDPKELVRKILKDSRGNTGKAISRLTFYINRGGENLSNKSALERAKKLLQNNSLKEQSSCKSCNCAKNRLKLYLT